MNIKTNRIIYYDFLKILATFAVVLLHAAALKWGNVEETSYEWKIMNFYDAIVRWAVPIFVMVSGALFLEPNHQVNIKKLYIKNIFHIITVFLFWSIFYAIISWTNGMQLKYAILSVVKGYYHQWFLFMIAGLYMLVPLLKKITETRKMTEYFLCIALVFTFIIPRILDLLTILELPHTVELTSALQAALSNMNFHFTLGFVAYFVLGHYLAKYEISKKLEFCIYILGILGFIATIVLTAWHSFREGRQNTTFYGEFTINVMLEAISVFTFAKCRISKLRLTEKATAVIHKMAQYGLGIYLVHVVILETLETDFQFHPLIANPIYMVPLVAIVVWSISLLISLILNHIPIIKKYIV